MTFGWRIDSEFVYLVQVLTGDLGGKGKCSEFTNEICSQVQNLS